ncbi:ArsR/SmtB family transcription factor [Georgenia subflava]|uniref:Metalloregulator ArsR/SmtB family transcription factor n=1 Tax=Georgenia subflava TaxID=1622177 RepID=A0A6N7EJB8_9MICO|nr:metalloregulator ArsR/SmtB family transcription factor [Georgenia subflava]MPV37521.1 metalloregulator ArsR/SmtB family transcription factor [Georgenia subflava]
MAMTTTVRDSRATQDSTDAPEAVAGPASLDPAAALFHSLSDPTRLRILQHLTAGEHRVRDLTEHLGLAQSTVSTHLSCLRDCGLVTSRPVGRASLFSLTTEPELLAVLRAAETLLGATGYAVTLCSTNGLAQADA